MARFVDGRPRIVVDVFLRVYEVPIRGSRWSASAGPVQRPRARFHLHRRSSASTVEPSTIETSTIETSTGTTISPFKRLSVSRSISASSLTFFGNWPPSPTASFPPLHLPLTLLASTWIAEREGYNSWHADHRYCILYQKGRFLIKNRGQRRREAFDTETSDGQRCCLVSV